MYKVREILAQKLHKGLIALKLPLQYMSIFCLVGQDVEKDRRVQVKNFLHTNINKRRDLLKTSVNANGGYFYVIFRIKKYSFFYGIGGKQNVSSVPHIIA